jgi:hypothetical protein
MKRHIIAATAALLLNLSTAQAAGLKPIQAQPIDLGQISGVAYYTVEPDGFHVVATLAPNGADGAPLRVQAALAPGQTVTFSVPSDVNAEPSSISIARRGDELVVSSASQAHAHANATD